MAAISQSDIRTVLLLPHHIKVSPANLPTLKAIQFLLNSSYEKTYCSFPDYFDSPYIRLKYLEKLSESVGETGFTIILIRDGKVVATGSAKEFGYLEDEKEVKSGGTWSGDGGTSESSLKRFELTAFGVSLDAQAAGLGARVLKEVQWVVENGGVQLASSLGAPSMEGVELKDDESSKPVPGLDLDKLKEHKPSIAAGLSHDTRSAELVLIAIREVGSEAYYQRRGFKTIWTKPVPAGRWECKKTCTMVYMAL